MTFRCLFLCATLAAWPLPALALTLECNVPRTNAGGGYITDVYVLRYDEGSGQAIVSDALILSFNKQQPMAAGVAANTAVKLVLTWRVLLTNSVGQTARMSFRAAYFKSDGTLLVRASPGGDYSDMFEGRGTCRPV